MANTPQFKVYNEAGDYVASFKEVLEAARFLAISETGASVRAGHAARDTIFTQWASWDAEPVVKYGQVGDAAESFDNVLDAYCMFIDARASKRAGRDLYAEMHGVRATGTTEGMTANEGLHVEVIRRAGFVPVEGEVAMRCATEPSDTYTSETWESLSHYALNFELCACGAHS